MLRLGKLESKVENIYNGTGGNLTNGTSTATPSNSNPEKVNVAGLSWIFIVFLCACEGRGDTGEESRSLLNVVGFRKLLFTCTVTHVWVSFLQLILLDEPCCSGY